MNQVVANKIFTTIKSDNLVDFSSLIKGRENFFCEKLSLREKRSVDAWF